MKKAANTQAKDLMSEEINKKIATLKPVVKEFFELCEKNAEEVLQGKLATFYLKVKYTKRMAELACQLNIGNREPDAVHDARIENAIVRGDWVYNGAKMRRRESEHGNQTGPPRRKECACRCRGSQRGV